MAAVAALVLPLAVLLLAFAVALRSFPRGLIVVGGAAIALAAAGYALLRRGSRRWLGAGAALLGLIVAVVTLIDDGDHWVDALLIGAGLALAAGALRAAFRVHTQLPRVARRTAEAPGPLLQPEVRGRKGGEVPPRRRGAEARDRADRAHARHRPGAARAGGGRRRGGRAGDGRRRRLAGGRRLGRLGARAALLLHPGRHPQPLRARSGRGPR